jgi:hypothetical protein
MATLLLTLALKQKRDLLRTRQIARQAAGLLGFDAQEQIGLAAAAFDLAHQALAPTGCAQVQFEIADDCLQIVFAPAPNARRRRSCEQCEPLRLSKSLPLAAAVQRADVPWMLQQLTEMAPCDVFEEVRKMNQELLQTLLALAKSQPQMSEAAPKSEPSAA